MSFGVAAVSRLILPVSNASLILKLSGLFGCIFAGIVIYVIFSILFKSREMQILLGAIRQIRRA
jgi:phage shock protein PspC (stress-responsive transcriptional regulator)